LRLEYLVREGSSEGRRQSKAGRICDTVKQMSFKSGVKDFCSIHCPNRPACNVVRYKVSTDSESVYTLHNKLNATCRPSL